MARKRPSGRAWVPNSLTTMNLVCGFLAILISMDRFRRPAVDLAAFDASCWLILAAGVFDLLDGKVAKLLKVTSPFGMKMDSFADMVTFGLAPAVLMRCTFLRPGSLPWHLDLAACGAYFLGAVFRLAKYNVSTHAQGYGFSGLPSPGAAATVVGFFMVARNHPFPPGVAALVVALTGVLMCSRVPYPGFKGNTRGENFFIAGLVATLLLLMIPFGPARMIFWTMAVYDVFLGWFWVRMRPRWAKPPRGRRSAQA